MQEITEQIFVFNDFFDEHMCDEWLERAEEQGFDAGAVFTPEGERMAEHIRNCQEAVIYDEETAQLLFEFIKEHVASHPQFGDFYGVHPRLRVLRYEQEQLFAPHTDASIDADDGLSSSRYTFLVYLNTPLEGGATYFPDIWTEDLQIQAQCGRALCFEHDVMHAGAAIQSGMKYLLRADLLFSHHA